MKYVLTIGSLLILCGCEMSTNRRCHFDNGRKAFVGLPAEVCQDDPVSYCKDKCKQHLNTIIRIQTEGGLYNCSCDDK
jgi:hypothetical protein